MDLISNYGKIRDQILSRHFAINAFFRTNYVSDNEPYPRQSYENPLIFTGHLMVCLAVEFELGNQKALDILKSTLKSIATHYKFMHSHFNGYIIRWDAVDSNQWNTKKDSYGFTVLDSNTLFQKDENGRYLYVTPLVNDNLDKHELNKSENRLWEPSIDEIVGLMMGYDVVFRLVKDPEIKQMVVEQVKNLGDYLAEYNYMLVRPSGKFTQKNGADPAAKYPKGLGGFTFRGSMGMNPALEYPLGLIFKRITGDFYSCSDSSDKAWEETVKKARAGIWDNISSNLSDEAVGKFIAEKTAEGAFVIGIGGILAGIFDAMTGLPIAEFIAGTAGAVVVLTSSILAPTLGVLGLNDDFLKLFSNGDLIKAYIILDKCNNNFDISHPDDAAVAFLFSRLDPENRFFMYMAGCISGTGGYAKYFPEHLALSCAPISDTWINPVAEAHYINWIAKYKNQYDPKSNEIELQNRNLAQDTIVTALGVLFNMDWENNLIKMFDLCDNVMHNGRILDWQDDGSWKLWSYNPNNIDEILLEKEFANGKWGSIVAGHTLVSMPNGRILDWESDGTWRLWDYNLEWKYKPEKNVNNSAFLVENLVAQGKWESIVTGHTLIPMPNGQVLDWQGDGTWRLWNYNPNNVDDIFPGEPVAEGKWESIVTGHTLIPMPNGQVLDWQGDGTWRLWNYNPNNVDDIFPGEPVAEGKWESIVSGHTLIPMPDGRVLDWQGDGTWRLWNYNPNNVDNVFPEEPFAQGKWESIVSGHTLIPVHTELDPTAALHYMNAIALAWISSKIKTAYGKKVTPEFIPPNFSNISPIWPVPGVSKKEIIDALTPIGGQSGEKPTVPFYIPLFYIQSNCDSLSCLRFNEDDSAPLFLDPVPLKPIEPPMLDQVNDPVMESGAVNIVPGNHVTQTFIPALSNLVAVEVGLRTSNAGRGGDNITMKISDAHGKELLSRTISIQEGFEGFLHFDISPYLHVTVGEPLKIELNDTGKTIFFWKYVAGNHYSRGQAMFLGASFDDNDFYFKTYGSE